MWSFVRCKANKRWIWLALCKHTRQVVACVIGGRGVATCRKLWRNVPESYKQGTIFSDFWEAYQAVIPNGQHEAVGKDSGLTAHIERFNNTIRQRTGPEGWNFAPLRCAVLSKTTASPLCQEDFIFL